MKIGFAVIIVQLSPATSVGCDPFLEPPFLRFQVRILKENYETLVDNIEKIPYFLEIFF